VARDVLGALERPGLAKPLTSAPPSSASVPIASGGATSATKLPDPGVRDSPGFGGTVPGSDTSRYSDAVHVVSTSRGPRPGSWWLGGCPSRCAPTTASRRVRASMRVPMSQSSASDSAGATNWTPNGTPVARRPAGRASAQRSIRFTKFV